MSHLVKRGTDIPTKKTNMFTTIVDNQTSVAVTVFKGERDFVGNNIKIGSLELDELAPAPRGVPEVMKQAALYIQLAYHPCRLKLLLRWMLIGL